MRRAYAEDYCSRVGVVCGVGAGAKRGEATASIVLRRSKIDGTLSDPVWGKATLVEPGYVSSNSPARLPTKAFLLFDKRFFYVGFECAEPDTSRLKMDIRTRDGPVWQGDCVEVFVCIEPQEGYKHIVVNPARTVFDQRCLLSGEKDASWNADVQVKTSVGKGKWSVTLAVL